MNNDTKYFQEAMRLLGYSSFGELTVSQQSQVMRKAQVLKDLAKDAKSEPEDEMERRTR